MKWPVEDLKLLLEDHLKVLNKGSMIYVNTTATATYAYLSFERGH